MASVPSDIRTCFVQLTGFPLPAQFTKQDVVKFITVLRASEMRKTACGVRLLNLYDNQANKWEIINADR